MSRASFIDFLEEGNRDFINYFNSESALGLVDTLRRGFKKQNEKRHCVLVSYDPPVSCPPVIFNWAPNEVWYLESPSMNQEFFEKVSSCLEESENFCVVFLERTHLPHRRKIQRFIRNYRKLFFRSRPRFVLAEYAGPLSRVKVSELTEELHGTLPTQ